MRHLSHLPIWRDANRLLLAIEQSVRQFRRDQKYTLGMDLRRQAMRVCQLILRAADKGGAQLARASRVMDAVDALKLQIQLGKSLREVVDRHLFATDGTSTRRNERRVRSDLLAGPNARLNQNRIGAACPSPLVD